MSEELRRIDRVRVCCRVVVRDRYGVWTAVTEDICSRGCRILTTRSLRPGTLLTICLSSDLFPEEIEAAAAAVWSTPDLLGVMFLGRAPSSTTGAGLSPEEWVRMVVEHGARPGASSSGVVPVVTRVPAKAPPPRASWPASSDLENLVRLPARHG